MITAMRTSSYEIQATTSDTLLTFKEAMNYLRVSRSTLYRFMWSGQLIGHKVGSTWRFYQADLRACIETTPTQATTQENHAGSDEGQAKITTATSR